MTLDGTCMRCNTLDESIMHVIHDEKLLFKHVFKLKHTDK